MRVALILPHATPDHSDRAEYERHYRERVIVERSRADGHEARLYMLTYEGERHRIQEDAEAEFFPVDDLATEHPLQNTSVALRQRIEEHQPDLIVFKGMSYRLNSWLLTTMRHRCPYAFIVGGAIRDPAQAHASYILAETEEQLRNQFPTHHARGQAAVLPKLLRPEDFRVRADKRYDIVNVGTFEPRKNQKALMPFFPRYKVALIGDGPCYEEVRKEAERYPDNVYMPGNLSRAEAISVIAQSRLMVHPAWHEGLPRVFAEASANGIPVVAYRDVVGAAFQAGVEGIGVSPDELVDAVTGLLDDDEQRERMGTRARQWAATHYTAEGVYGAIRRVYDQAEATRQRGIALRLHYAGVRARVSASRLQAAARVHLRQYPSLRRLWRSVNRRNAPPHTE